MLKKLMGIGVVSLCIIISACALSPQTVSLQPDINVSDNPPILNTTASVKVEDNRGTSVVGSRGGVYANSSQITSSADVMQNTQKSVERALRIMGVTVTNQNPAYQIDLILDKLSYKASDKGYFAKHSDVMAGVSLKVAGQGQQFTGHYNANLNYEDLTAPSAEQNTKLLNQALSNALRQAVNDPKFLKFMQESSATSDIVQPVW